MSSFLCLSEDESNWEMPCSNSLGIEALVSTSNIGESGVWLFQIDGKEIAPACKSKGELNSFLYTLMDGYTSHWVQLCVLHA